MINNSHQHRSKALTGIESYLRIDYDTYPPATRDQQTVQSYLGMLVDTGAVTFTVERVPKGDLEVFSGGTLIWSLNIEGCSEGALKKLKDRLYDVKEERTPKGGYYYDDSTSFTNANDSHIIADFLKDRCLNPIIMEDVDSPKKPRTHIHSKSNITFHHDQDLILGQHLHPDKVGSLNHEPIDDKQRPPRHDINTRERTH